MRTATRLLRDLAWRWEATQLHFGDSRTRVNVHNSPYDHSTWSQREFHASLLLTLGQVRAFVDRRRSWIIDLAPRCRDLRSWDGLFVRLKP